MIKLSTVATDMMGVSGRAMIEALIAGERDPQVLAELAQGRMRVKRAALVEALTGRFNARHAELARMLLMNAYDSANAADPPAEQRIKALIATLPAPATPRAWTHDGAPPANAGSSPTDGTTGPDAGSGPDAPGPPAFARFDEIPSVELKTAAGDYLREIGLDMTRFPTAAHLVSWARLSPSHSS